MRLSVKAIREQGLEAKWTKTRTGRPAIVVRKPDTRTWYWLTDHMWKRAAIVGLVSAFEETMLTADFFSVSL